MAKKSKTQRAKASAARAQKKEQLVDEPTQQQKEIVSEQDKSEKKAKAALASKEEPKQTTAAKKPVKKEEKDTSRFRPIQFLKDVRAELRRVTWPSRQDVFRWSLVVLAALIFFGLFTLGFDTLFDRLLLLYGSLGALVHG